jgi:hypothetical protein
MVDTLVEIAERHPDQELAVFGHDFAIRCLVVVLKNDLGQLKNRIPYCGETHITYDNSQLYLNSIGIPVIRER